APTGVVINDYAKAKDPLTLQAEELVLHFHQLFHGVETHQPQSKEMGQALALVAQHGLPASKHIVEFAHREASKTKYQAQHFGAVLNYTSRALLNVQQQREVATRQNQPEMEPLATAQPSKPAMVQQKRLATGERRLAALTSQQYHDRFEQAREQLL